MGFIGFNGKRYEVSRAEYDQLKGKSVDQKLNLLRSWGKEQEAPIIPTRAEILAQEQAQNVSEAEKQRKLEWIQQQEQKGAILSPSLKAEIEPVKKQAWIARQEAKGAILSPSLKAELKASIQQTPTIETGREVSISPAVANKLGLISKQEQQEAEAKGSFFIHRKETVKESPEETMARLRSGDVIAYKDKTGEVVFADNLSQVPKGAKIVKPSYFGIENQELKVFSVPSSTYFHIKREQAYAESVDKKVDRIIDEATNMEKVGMVAHTLLSPSGYSLMSSVLLRKELTGGITPRQVVAQRMGKIGKERIWKQPLEQQINYAVQNAIDNPITQVELATLSGIGFAKIASTSLGARALGSTAGKLLLGTAGAYSLGSSASEIGKMYTSGRKAEASGRALSLGFSIIGALQGYKIGSRYYAKPEPVVLKPEKVYLKTLRKETPEGNIQRVGQVDIQTEQGNMKADLMAVKTKQGIEKYYYDVPQQKVGSIKINAQKILVEEGDTVKIKTAIDEFITYKQSTKVGIKAQLEESTGANEVELYLKNVKEITNVQPKGDVTAFRRAGSVKGAESWAERGYATPTKTIGKGIMAKPAGEFQYFYLEKDITPQVSGLTDLTKPVIRGTTKTISSNADNSLATSENVVTSALKRLSALRSLQEVKLTGSINTANTGRIIPPLLQTNVAENINDISTRTNRIIAQAVIASTQGVRIKKREAYYVPSIIDSAMIGALQNIERATKQITGSLQGTRQVQTPAQKFIQEVGLITQPETPTRTTTRTVTQTRPPRITEINVPQIERPPRIAFPRPFFNVGMGYSSKDLETYLRSIQHSMISAMRLVV
jgi:hypothetical protein